MRKYRDIGFKLTPQRIAILDYLEGNRQHPSAEEIYGAVLKKFSTLSLATVYTTLTALKVRGRIVELTIDPSKKRYDPQAGSHNHLICVSCKRIIDIPPVRSLELLESVKQEFTLINAHVEFYGLCPKCTAKTPLQKTNQGGSRCA
jgi:Fur family peroxide stress response transcriptional regulator